MAILAGDFNLLWVRVMNDYRIELIRFSESMGDLLHLATPIPTPSLATTARFRLSFSMHSRMRRMTISSFG